MSDEQVVEKLARRMGYIDLKWDWFDGHSTWKDWTWTRGGQYGHGLPNYLASRDALQPILEGLSGEQWCHLFWQLTHHKIMPDESDAIAFTRYLLTMPPRDLAHALASILEDKQ